MGSSFSVERIIYDMENNMSTTLEALWRSVGTLAVGRRVGRRPLRGREQRCEAVLEHLMAKLSQSVVADRGRQAEAVGDSLAPFVDPAHPRPPPRLVRCQSLCESSAAAQGLCEHARILHSHAAALSHHRRARMRGVTDENDPACVPSIQGDPVNRGAVDLLVALNGCKILLDDPAKSGKVVTQAGEPADHRLVSS